MSQLLSNGRQAAMDSSARQSFLTSAIFKIENNGKGAAFSELAGISTEIEQAEYMQAGTRGPEFGRFVGKAKPPTITLKRAMSVGIETAWIWEWHAEARAGVDTAYRNTTFQLYGASDDPSGTAAMSYMLVNAFPTKVEIAGMKAGATEIVMQTVTLQCDEIIEA